MKSSNFLEKWSESRYMKWTHTKVYLFIGMGVGFANPIALLLQLSRAMSSTEGLSLISFIMWALLQAHFAIVGIKDKSPLAFWPNVVSVPITVWIIILIVTS